MIRYLLSIWQAMCCLFPCDTHAQRAADFYVVTVATWQETISAGCFEELQFQNACMASIRKEAV